MVKTKEEIIAQFNEEVNMTVEELEAWLDDPKSTKAGTGVGIESGHKIIEILRKNPTKDPKKYDDDDLEHMRKVVGYAARHLAQEDKLKETKTREELENAKSTISLKNWGHDPVKALNEEVGDVENETRKPTEDNSAKQPGKEGEITKNGKKDVKSSEGTNGFTEAEVETSGQTPMGKDEEKVNGSGVDEEAKKRKLDEDEPAARGADASEVDEVDVVHSDGADEVERPRKKSKVDGEETAA